jgi:hypothetical protein
MSVTGLCAVCENAPARHTCSRCGAAVCTDHYDRRDGLCTVCEAQVGGGRGDGGPGGRS